MIEIEIDGKTLPAEPGETIIQVADKAGIYIPRFCYHKKLSVVASCRMCLVDVEKAPKTLPACATPVAPGMKVNTRSEKALFSQKTVMEFLLINHPLDCPICDQGGECELQDLSLGYGEGISRFSEGKRAVHDENLGSLISTEMTRCIQCTRCVRFGDEVAGLRELGAMGRGEDVEIATYVEQTVRSELSGNIIDICPVGALTSKPYRFTARAWELQQHESIAPHDCLGSNLYIHTRGEEYTPVRHVMRVVPRENESINETWISDRDRFSYEAINSPQRILKPLLKQDNRWIEVSWDKAISEAAKRLQSIIQEFGPEQIGALVSPSATLEECYLTQKLFRDLGSHNIDHRLRHTDFRHQNYISPYPSLGLPIAELEKLNSLLLVGSHVRSEQPIASGRIRKAVKQGANVLCINPVDYDFNFSVTEKCIVGAHEFVATLAKILAALCARSTSKTISTELKQFLTSFQSTAQPTAVEIAIADKLLAGEKAAVILGAYATQHPDAALIHFLSHQIADYSGASFGILSEGANSTGAWLAGAVPHHIANHVGRNAREMFEEPLRAYLLLNIEPELDSAYPTAALAALKQARCVISCTAFKSEAIEEYADIILPIATFAETPGIYINAEGTWQSIQPATMPQGEAKPAWEILCELGNKLSLSEFPKSIEAVRDVLEEKISNVMTTQNSVEINTFLKMKATVSSEPKLQRITEWPMYCVDTLVRHAPALQAAISENDRAIRINEVTAQHLNLQLAKQVVAVQNQARITLPLVIDPRMPNYQVWIPAGLELTAGFGESFGEVTLMGTDYPPN